MRGSILNQFTSGFFAYVGIYTATYFVFCFSFPTKVERKKAILAAVIYSLVANIINLVPLVLVGNQIIPETTTVFLFNQFLVVLTEVLLVIYLSRYIEVSWYKIYWLEFTLIAFAILPVQKFALVDRYMIFEIPYMAFLEVNLQNIIPYTLTVVLLPFVLIAIIVFVIRWCRKNMKFYQLPQLFWIIINVILGVYILNLHKSYTSDLSVVTDPYRGVGTIFELITTILVISVVVVLFVDHIQKKYLQQENSLLKEQNELRYESYIEKQKMEFKIQKLYHDIGNHIKTIQILVDNNDMEVAKEYTSDLLLEYTAIRKYCYCNHEIVNAVFIDKSKRCESLGINLDIDINLPETIEIRDIDLMSVFTNLLDNGIEACERNQGKENYILVRVGMIGDYLGIKVKNSKSMDEQMDGRKSFKTTKKDKQSHGYGTKIIKEVVERYDGQMEYKIAEESVDVVVMLMLKEGIN